MRRRPSPIVLALVALTIAVLAWRAAHAEPAHAGPALRIDARAGVTSAYMELNGPSDLTNGGWVSLAIELPERTTFGGALRVARTTDFPIVVEDGRTHATTAGIAVTARRGRWSTGIEGGVAWTTYGRDPEFAKTGAHGFIGVPFAVRLGGPAAFVLELEPIVRLDDGGGRSPFGGVLRLGASYAF